MTDAELRAVKGCGERTAEFSVVHDTALRWAEDDQCNKCLSLLVTAIASQVERETKVRYLEACEQEYQASAADATTPHAMRHQKRGVSRCQIAIGALAPRYGENLT